MLLLLLLLLTASSHGGASERVISIFAIIAWPFTGDMSP